MGIVIINSLASVGFTDLYLFQLFYAHTNSKKKIDIYYVRYCNTRCKISKDWST